MKKYDVLEKGKKAEEELVTLTGRIVSKRESSSKLIFYDIVQNGETMQVVASRARYNGTPAEFADSNHELCRGDIACKVKRGGMLQLYMSLTHIISIYGYTRKNKSWTSQCICYQ